MVAQLRVSGRVLVCSLTLLACSEAVENPAAYDAEVYLCDAAHADVYESRIADCIASNENGAGCGGIASFRGRIEGLRVTVDSELSRAEFSDVNADDGTRRRDDMKLFGRSPYFQFQFQWKEIGGDLLGGGDDRTLEFGAPREAALALYDDRIRPSLRLSVGGESRDFSLGSGTLTIDRQTATEEIGSFEARINADGDRLEGCFYALAPRGDS
jgi:hypothetical protein